MSSFPLSYLERRQQLTAMVEGLIQRPTMRSSETEVRGEHALPFVYLVDDAGDQGFLGSLERKLDVHPSPRVPYAVLDADVGEERGDGEPPPLVPLLDLASRSLAGDRFSSHRPLRFSRYRLVHWLTGHRLTNDRRWDDDRQITEALRTWRRRSAGSGGQAIDETVNEIPSWWLRTVLRVLTVVGRLFRARTTGIERERRWLMRQRYLVPKHSTSFEGFARRLTVGQRDKEDPEQLRKLLVHAFLEDLRAAYGRWNRGLPKRSGWRRTGYAVLLLKNVSEGNGGWELLRLINEVRNETGEHDPLLVIASGHLPAGVPEPSAAIGPEAALATWRRELPGRRQRMDPYARHLWISGARSYETGVHPADTDGFAPSRRPHFLAWRGVGETALSLALVAGLLPLTVNVIRAADADCPSFNARSSGGVSVMLMETEDGEEECVGHSDEAKHVFGSKEARSGKGTSRLWNAQRLVFEQNALAERLRANNPARPLVTLVYLADLTPRGEGVPATTDASAEELEGLVMRQRQQHGLSSRVKPVLRIVVANGGSGMLNSLSVVKELVIPLAERDPSIMGVIGLNRTIDVTEEVITALGTAGIPTVGTTLTGTGLDERSPLYFQMVPDNTRQATLVAEYADYLDVSTVVIAHPELEDDDKEDKDASSAAEETEENKDKDTYISSLVKATKEKVNESRRTKSQKWEEGPHGLDSLCSRDRDPEDELLYYVGREQDFGDFLTAIISGCGMQERPRILASDAVSRFIAEPDERDASVLQGLPVSYVGMGPMVTLAGQRCVDGSSTANGSSTADPLGSFCAEYNDLRGDDKKNKVAVPAVPWPAERSGITYDTADAFLKVMETGPKRHRAAVSQLLRERKFSGATGVIDFSRSRIGNERPIAVLKFANISDVGAVPVCEYMIGKQEEERQYDQETGCP